jgi:putative NADH-flavin reductase
MKLTVFGATGATGTQIVRLALDRGHHVTAVVRDPSRLPAELAGRADVAAAELSDLDTIRPTIAGADAVLNAIGPRDRTSPTTVCADSTRSIIAALHAEGSGARLVIASNSALAPGPGDDPFTRYFVKPVILSRILRHVNDDARAAEGLARAAGLPWTIVRAGMLTDRQGKGAYRRAVERNVLGGFQVTRNHFAAAMLDAAIDPNAEGRVLSVAS